MKRALLVVIGILVTTSFSLYILDINPFSKNNVSYQKSADSDLSVVYIGENATPAMDTINTQQETKDTVQAQIDTKTAQFIQNSSGTSGNDEWKLVWADEFDKPNINLEYWTKVDRKNNFNHELQYYLPANSYIADGCLYLTAKREEKEGKGYTSAMIETRNKLSLRYGRIDARMRLPVGKGLFPAFWMLTENENEEIDIMEMVDNEPYTIYGVNHYDNGTRKIYGAIINNNPQDFHIYTLEWEKGGLKWYVDGVLFLSTSEGVPSRGMYIIFTLAVGGDWPGPPDNTTIFPSSIAVDYVKIYKHE